MFNHVNFNSIILFYNICNQVIDRFILIDNILIYSLKWILTMLVIVRILSMMINLDKRFQAFQVPNQVSS
jgi:hypothetical protein